MLKIYKTENKKLIEKHGFSKNSWISLVNPTGDEVSKIVEKFDIPMDFVLDALDTDERSRVNVEDGKLFIVIRVPMPDINDVSTPFSTTSLGIFVFGGHIMTIYKNTKFNILEDLFNNRTSKIDTNDNIKLLLKIFRKTAILYLKYLKEINSIIEGLEKEFNLKISNNKLSQLLNLEKSIIYFKTGLSAKRSLLINLKNSKR